MTTSRGRCCLAARRFGEGLVMWWKLPAKTVEELNGLAEACGVATLTPER